MTTFRGKPCCFCLAEWLPVYEQLLQHQGLLSGQLKIYQLNGSATASAGTHKGGAFDIGLILGHVAIARQMGADATWERTRAQGFDTPHIHGVLTGCPHNTAARYQIPEVQAGRNGLANRGPDDGPRPLSGRTWQQGIAWARSQMEDDMADPKIREQLDRIEKFAARAADQAEKARKGSYQRDKRLIELARKAPAATVDELMTQLGLEQAQ